MKTAYDAQSASYVTVAQYHSLYGSKLLNGKLNSRPDTFCPACDEKMHIVGETKLVDATWAHNPSPTFCPIKNSGASKYSLLQPNFPDPARAAALRTSFFKNWKMHWSYVRSKAVFADVVDLSAFIAEADRTNLWGHATVCEWQLPYIFLATCEFPPPKGKAATHRKTWLRFRFDARVRTIEELWIRIQPDVRLLQLQYRNPRSGMPKVSHYLDSKSWPLDADWMTKHSLIAPHAFAIRHMHARFPSELGPLPP